MHPTNMLYPTEYAIIWLSIDSVIFLVLFVVFNVTMPRDFGTPLIGWRELFRRTAWRRVFNEELFAESPKPGCLIRVDGLSKTYHGEKDIVALTDVSFDIALGEVIVVIGPNGAGKSTMMNILSGALEPSVGTLSIMGRDPTTRFKTIQKYLGVCFQENVLIPLLTMREHLLLFGAFRGVGEAELESAIDFFADQLQLREMMTNRARDLSGGQKRKLCISLSLLGNPPIVIMDEPTAGVDVQARQVIWKTIAALKDTTTLVTSHALEEAEAVSSRLFIVAGGRLPFSGTSTELREHFKCGYLLRIEKEDGDASQLLSFVQRFVPEARVLEDRKDIIAFPVSSGIPQLLREMDGAKESLGVKSYSLCVEQLEDMLLKLIMTEEAQVEMEN
jgi:ABC-type multidrug transport system ATPase subunit